jgi:hypothetical protein
MNAMRTLRLGIVAMLAATSALSCSTMEVKTNYNPSAQFGRYRTYAWLPNTDEGRHADLMRGSPAEQRIRADVDRQLAARGIVPAPPGQPPDFLVTYHAALEEKVSVRDWGYGYGYRYAWGPGMGPDAYSYTQGTLIIDFIDPATQQSFWRGYASDAVDNPGSGGGKIDEAVSKIMQKYPPARNLAAAKQQH